MAKQSRELAVEKSLHEGKSVRRRLPGGGLLQIDRPVPVIIVYRRRADQVDEATDKLLAHATSALVAGIEDDITELVDTIAGSEAAAFGSCLILEIWPGPELQPGSPPQFVIHGPKRPAFIPLVESLQNELSGIEVDNQAFEVIARRGLPTAPPGLEPLMTESRASDLKCILFGLEIPPVYRNPDTGEAWPLILRNFRRDLTQVFRHWVYGFLHDWTTLRPACHNEIGSRTIAPVVWRVDEQLSEVADAFDFLLQVTPVNSGEAWQRFKASKYEEAPVLQYRPVPVEPTLLKRRLYAVPIERIEDPALCRLFREKQEELDRKITLIMDRNTPRFVHGSIQLFGGVDDDFYGFAREMLENLPPEEKGKDKEKEDGPALDATAFAALAETEIASFRKQYPEVDSSVQVREDIYTGLMVSRGSVLIGANLSIPASRAEALLQHEVGTHVLTYWNGKAQPFRQLYSGLAGYDALQEGLAVLAEAFVDGLSRSRKRLLLGRVVAVRLMIDGATFVDTFRELHHKWNFPARVAFTITLRVYRGGGLTKDAVYVRGIGELLDYLRGGGELESLLVGKFAVEHVALVEELRAREILVAPPIRPGYFDSPHMELLMDKIRSGQTLFQMLRDQRKLTNQL